MHLVEGYSRCEPWQFGRRSGWRMKTDAGLRVERTSRSTFVWNCLMKGLTHEYLHLDPRRRRGRSDRRGLGAQEGEIVVA